MQNKVRDEGAISLPLPGRGVPLDTMNAIWFELLAPEFAEQPISACFLVRAEPNDEEEDEDEEDDDEDEDDESDGDDGYSE